MPRFIVKDSFYNKAKKEGFRARSAYKLGEIQERFRVIRKGDRVLDLGAAPGSWLQLEATLTGETGIVVGIDLLPISPMPAKHVVLRQGDIRDMEVNSFLPEYGIAVFDVITSDVAPSLSGIKEVDNANVRDLYFAVLKVVKEALRKGGNFVIKLFFSPQLGDMSADLRPLFTNVTTFKPKASRGVSSEVYLVCMGKR
jgi:23S rRNA (uridine2552-2'-O)-methyltransferase